MSMALEERIEALTKPYEAQYEKNDRPAESPTTRSLLSGASGLITRAVARLKAEVADSSE